VFSVGDPFVYFRGQPIASGLSNCLFECPATCSSLMLRDGPAVTVIREYMHMHYSGHAMYNEHVRNGHVIRTGAEDFFEFAVSGGPAVQQNSFEIMPGDAFNVQCYYQNDDASDNRTFGLASSQGMCVAFLLYYRTPGGWCRSPKAAPWGGSAQWGTVKRDSCPATPRCRPKR
jgi:Copper type II ascorbate-dependent monooxygenase, C-terminal domain